MLVMTTVRGISYTNRQNGWYALVYRSAFEITQWSSYAGQIQGWDCTVHPLKLEA